MSAARLIEAANTTSMIFIVIFGALVLTQFVTVSGLGLGLVIAFPALALFLPRLLLR